MAIKKAKAFPVPNLVNYIKLANNVKSDDETRAYMCECYYEADAGEYGAIVSTDGRRLMVWKLAESALKTLTGSDTKPSSGFVALDTKRMDMRPIKLDAQFPNWIRIIPESKELSEIPFLCLPDAMVSIAAWTGNTGIVVNPYYLVDIPMTGKSKVLGFAGELKKIKPIIIETSSFCGEVLVVVMPMMVEGYV